MQVQNANERQYKVAVVLLLIKGLRMWTNPPIFTIIGIRHQQRFKNWLQV